MAFSIESGKETGLIQINVVPKPLVLCQITAVNGDTVYLTTTPELGGATRVYAGNTYQAVLKANPIEQIQAQSPQGYDIPGSITLTIADGDFVMWLEHANLYGWRGGELTVTFVLWDAPSDSYSTNAYVWTFILDKPSIDSTGILTVAAQARQSMTRVSVPNFARQNRCGNTFPATAAQRASALNDPTSIYWGCGYSADQTGGCGNPTTHSLTNPDGSALTDAAGNYVMCDYTRSSGAHKTSLTQGCMARMGNYASSAAADGDLEHDVAGHVTGRFTGDTWLAPAGWKGKEYDNPNAGRQYGFNAVNAPTGATHYNQGYGTQWVTATILEPFSDPNFYSAECIVCMAPVNAASILMVLVNWVQVTQDNSDQQFTWKLISSGGRNGAITNVPIMNGQGDPHGSMCKILIGVPVELQTSGSLANVQVLVEFPPPLQAMVIASYAPGAGSTTVLTFGGTFATWSGYINYNLGTGVTVYIQGCAGIPDGPYLTTASAAGSPNTATITGVTATGTGGSCFFFPGSPDGHFMVDSQGNAAANPVWALMDLLAIWGPFTTADFDVQSWFDAAQACAAQISYSDLNGVTQTHARFRCSFVLSDGIRQSLAKAVLAVRNCAGLILGRNPATGQLQCFVEETLADQQPAPIPGSNYNTAVASLTAASTAPLTPSLSTPGYLAYLFDGAGSIEKDTFKLGGRSLNDTPNTLSFPFQDSANSWVQDSCTTIDPKGYITAGNQQVQAQFAQLGIENFDQAFRRSNVELAKALYGNSRFDAGGTELPAFRATAKAAHLAGRVGFIVGIKYDQLGI